MSKIRDDAFKGLQKIDPYIDLQSFRAGWSAALAAAANRCEEIAARYDSRKNGDNVCEVAMLILVMMKSMLESGEMLWPGESPPASVPPMNELAAERKSQADDDPNDCHDWTPKGM